MDKIFLPFCIHGNFQLNTRHFKVYRCWIFVCVCACVYSINNFVLCSEIHWSYLKTVWSFWDLLLSFVGWDSIYLRIQPNASWIMIISTVVCERTVTILSSPSLLIPSGFSSWASSHLVMILMNTQRWPSEVFRVLSLHIPFLSGALLCQFYLPLPSYPF